ncbi:MAG: RagB/SusD family nutrient uptake outer membrane protein, partial [Bacteroidota bacterium]
EHIFFDLRRWLEPVESQQTAFWLVPTLHKDEDGNRYFEYELEEFEREFTEAWRLMPLHTEQLILNPELVQNPGWE